jgi:hypothetical protein
MQRRILVLMLKYRILCPLCVVFARHCDGDDVMSLSSVHVTTLGATSDSLSVALHRLRGYLLFHGISHFGLVLSIRLSEL